MGPGHGRPRARLAGRDARDDPRLARRPSRHARARGAAVVGRAGRPARRHRMRPHRDDRRLDAERASVLAIARQAEIRRRDPKLSCPARRRRRWSASAPAPASSIFRQALADGARAGAPQAEAPRAEGFDAISGGALGLVAPLAEEKLAKAFVDFQNDVTARDIKLGDARRHALDRAHQALHHDRHGDRSGQNLQHERARHRRRHPRARDRRSRPHHLPPALHARHLRHFRRPVEARDARSDPRDADPFLVRRPRARSGRRRACGSAPRASRCPAKAPRRRSSASA